MAQMILPPTRGPGVPKGYARTGRRGTSVAPPAITVAASGLDATITNTGGAAASINWGDGTTNTSLTHTYATQGVWEVVASNAGGSSSATAIVSGFWATGRTANCYTDNGGTTPATTGDPVAVEKSPNTGLTSLAQTDPSKRPLTQTDGLSLQTDDLMTFTSVALSGDFTVYFVGTMVSANMYIPFGSVAGSATIIPFTNTEMYVINDSGGSAAFPTFGTSSGLYIYRLRRTGGTMYAARTGTAEASQSDPGGTFTFDCFGARPAFGQATTSTDQRYLSRLTFNRNLSSGERTLIEAYLLAQDGAAL